jgi:outer membrane protein assembly factor BamB
MKWLTFMLLLACAPALAQTWTRAHGGPDNAGFANVVTDPITVDSPRVAVPALGIFAAGAGPVVDKNGTAYLGAINGQLIAIGADGTRLRTAQLPPDRRIFTSPIIASDGSIYVAASISIDPTDHDHRQVRAWLYRFSPQLDQLWERPLPVRGQETGTAVALNATGEGTAEIIAVAAVVKSPYTVNIAGFTPDGALLFSQDVGAANGLHSGNLSWLKILCWPFANACRGDDPVLVGHSPPDALPSGIHSLPVGIAVSPGDVFVVTDGVNGIRGYHFSPGGLTKVFEKIDARTLTSSAAVLPNHRSVYGVTDGRIAFSGPSNEHVADINQEPGPQGDLHHPIEAIPARLADGRIVSVNRFGSIEVINNVVPVGNLEASADTIAGVSASKHVFYLSTASRLLSFDADTLALLSTFPLTDGGQSSPAIGSNGRVYVLAGDTLTIFTVGKARPPTHIPDGPVVVSPELPQTPALPPVPAIPLNPRN